ncbi:MAG: SDR family oxidoreductase, partial [Acidobacteriota bacterium]
PLDILINNAGVGVNRRDLGELDYDQILSHFRVNAMGPLRLTEALLPRLRQGERKLVVNMTSRMGSIDDNGSGGAYAYRGSKAALNMFNRSLAVDLGPEGIVCVVLHPGWVRTRMGGSSAPTSVEESVGGLIEVIDGLDQEDSGRFYDYTGEEIPW